MRERRRVHHLSFCTQLGHGPRTRLEPGRGSRGGLYELSLALHRGGDARARLRRPARDAGDRSHRGPRQPRLHVARRQASALLAATGRFHSLPCTRPVGPLLQLVFERHGDQSLRVPDPGRCLSLQCLVALRSCRGASFRLRVPAAGHADPSRRSARVYPARAPRWNRGARSRSRAAPDVRTGVRGLRGRLRPLLRLAMDVLRPIRCRTRSTSRSEARGLRSCAECSTCPSLRSIS